MLLCDIPSEGIGRYLEVSGVRNRYRLSDTVFVMGVIYCWGAESSYLSNFSQFLFITMIIIILNIWQF
jgi:hypothetical protein